MRLTAGLYAKRGGMDTLLIEKMFPGGQIATTYMVENYPGFDEPIGGPELAMKLEAHARKFGLEILYDEVAELKLDDKIKKVITSGGEYQAKALILCMGAEAKTLGLDKEDLFRGRGVPIVPPVMELSTKINMQQLLVEAILQLRMLYSWHSMPGRCIYSQAGCPQGFENTAGQAVPESENRNTLGYGS